MLLLRNSIIYLLLIACTSTNAQDLNQIKIFEKQALNSDAKIKAHALVELGEEYMDFDTTTALNYFYKAIEFANKNNIREQLIYAYENIASLYCDRQMYKSGIPFYYKALNYCKTDADKIPVYKNLITTYLDLYDFTNADKLLTEFRIITTRIKVFDIVSYYTLKATLETRKGDFKLCDVWIDSGKYILSKIQIKDRHDSLILIGFYQVAANIYSNRGRLDANAIKLFEDYIKLAENDNRPKILQTAYTNFGILYFYQNRYFKAIKWFKKIIPIGLSSQNNTILAESYINVGSCFDMIGHYDSAMYYYKLGLNYSNLTKDSLFIDVCISNLALTSLKMGDYINSRKYIQSIENNILNIPNDEARAIYFIIKGEIENKEKKYTLAKNDILFGVKNLNGNNKYDLLEIAYRNLAEISEKTGLKDSAIIYLKLHQASSDSIKSIFGINSIDEADSKYEVGKEMEKNDFLNTENINMNIKMIFWIITFLVIIFLFMIAFLYSKRRHNLYVKNKRIEMGSLKGLILGRFQTQHTLSGILNNIALLIENNEQETARIQAIETNKLIRKLIFENQGKNTLSNELNMIRMLLEYEAKIRKFTFTIDVSKEVSAMKNSIILPSLILYIPIYNSIEYAIGKMKDQQIHISLEIKNDLLFFKIKDSGKSLIVSSQMEELRGIGTKLMNQYIEIATEMTGKVGSFSITEIIENGKKIGNESTTVIPLARMKK